MHVRSKCKRINFYFAAIILIFSVSAIHSAKAQVAGAALSGRITDSSGGAVANAQVGITNSSTGITQTWTTNTDGLYSAPNLPPGTYQITVSAPGFAKAVQSGAVLGVGVQQVLDLSLQVGQVQESVEVTGSLPDVQLTNATLSGEVTQTIVHDLPLNGRDWTQLATLQAGVIAVRSQASTTSTANRGNRGYGNELSDSGHRPYENNYRMNGISVNDYSNGAPGSTLGVNLGVDAIQEFSVEVANYSAEYGRTSGGVINAITRSGANSFHGSAYWFLRDEGFDARNFFDGATIPPFHRNQFGASSGGRIKKDNTFFFADYEGVRQNLGQTLHDSVPTQAARGGSLCSQPTLFTGTPCTPNSITVDSKVARFLQFYPLPNGGLSPTGHGDIGFFNGSGTTVVSENFVTARIDHKISAKDSIDGTYLFDTAPQTFPDSLLNAINENLSGRQMVAVEETHIATSTFVNTVRIGWNRTTALVSASVSAINPAAKDSSYAAVPGQYAPIIVVPGLTQFQGGFGALSYIAHAQNSSQAYDDAFWTRGVHSLKFGFSVERIQYNNLARIRENGQFAFPSLQGFLQNMPTNVQLLSPFVPAKEEGSRQTLLGGYIQDDWRVRSNLTLNLGLRYERSSLPSEAHRLFGELPDFFTSTTTPVDHLWTNNPTNLGFEPRVGFAYDPFRTGRTSIRGGFGIYDIEPLPWVYTLGTSQVLPFALQVSAAPLATGTFPDGVASLVAGTPVNPASRYVGGYLNQPIRRSFAMNWNLNVQRQLGWSTTLMVGYAGSHTEHLPENVQDANMVLPTLTPAGYEWPFPLGNRANPNVGIIKATLFNGTAVYNGLTVQLTKRTSHGLQFQGGYTNGLCTDNGSSGATDSFTNSLQSPHYYDYPLMHGPCDFDIRSNFVMNFVWEVPTLKSSSSLASHVIGGWELGGLVSASTGTPFTPVIGGDPLGQRSTTPIALPNRLVGGACDNPVNPGNPNNYINLACFTPPTLPAGVSASSLPFPCVPAAATVSIPNTCMNLLGNSSRNSVRGPGLVDLDFTVIKNNLIKRVSESFNVQFRAEFFNILNRANFQSPNGNDGNSTVLNSNGTTGSGGVLDVTTTTSRQIQLALKVIW